MVAAAPQLPALAGVRSPAFTLISIAALALWGWRNRHSAGALLTSAGCLLNLGTMLVHGGSMPVHPDTLARIGISASTGTALLGSKDMVADLALISNLILIGATMALFGASLTLPGIAGIALTVGMAVDANVLINERIREELRLGKSPLNAVEAGYDRAFSAIFDSNLTTIIAAVALYAFGTGPIKGFAVTLTIGLVWSMFTAIMGTRVVFDWLLSRGGVKRLSI